MRNAKMKIELSTEDLEMICNALTTEWLDINDKFTLWEDAGEAQVIMDRCTALKNRLCAVINAKSGRKRDE